ncbi:FkbM family methyltransferase [Erythrobacter sp. HKB08]|uniref:FkbM family methyltransferase n=1 Tax=Erythrobacter sp. HKB08 TaxID=2502843 RepID=UPI0013E8D7B6|nr:FkbM family methyltransferase [Erythrobacter sp. HKB08]
MTWTSEALHDALAGAAPVFASHDHYGELAIAGRTYRIPWLETGAPIEPADWYVLRHDEASLHEPGMIAAIARLTGIAGERPVRFVDIGAAYGYFGLVADALFEDVSVIAVEASQALATYCETLFGMNRLERVQVVNTLLSDRTGAASLAQRNFSYLPQGAPAPEGYADTQVDQRTLLQVLPEADGRLDVLKIDSEGWQARFLPPATDELVRRGAAILLECDSPEKLAPFASTNGEIVAPFLDAGYRLLWCDHRKPDFTVETLAAMGPGQERNGLAILLPPELAGKC